MAPSDRNDRYISGDDIFNSGGKFKKSTFHKCLKWRDCGWKARVNFQKVVYGKPVLGASELHMVITEINELVSIPSLQCLAP